MINDVSKAPNEEVLLLNICLDPEATGGAVSEA